MHVILSSLGCPINRRTTRPPKSRSRVPDRLAKMFRARCLPLVSKTKAPQTEICGASFLAKSSNVDQRFAIQTRTYTSLGGLKDDSLACCNIGTVSAEVVISRHVAELNPGVDITANKRD